MIRTTTRPPSAQCTLPMYMGFLMSEPQSPTCTRLGDVMGVSHDSVNRFLLRESVILQNSCIYKLDCMYLSCMT